MKFVCLRDNLRENLAHVDRVAGRNLTLPILQNTLLATEKGRLRISATNLEIGLRAVVNGKVEEEGSVTVPAHTLLGFVSAIPEEKITLEQQDHRLLVYAGRYRAECKGLDPKDFPIIPRIEEEFSATLPAEALTKALQALAALTASGETRPELAGVYVAFRDGEIQLAATDSFRLGECIVPYAGAVTKDLRDYIIPSRTVSELGRILAGAGGDAVFVAGGNQVAIRVGEMELISRLIEGKYPNYRAVVPSSFATEMFFDRGELTRAIRAAGIFSGKLQDVKFSFRPAAGILTLESRNSEVGEERVEVGGDGEGKELSASFNFRYLLDALENSEGEKISLSCNKESDPVLIRGQGSERKFFLVMPLRSLP